MRSKKRKILMNVIFSLAIVLITSGVSLAFYSYAKEGTEEHVIRTGDISFHYEEASRGITLNNVLPMTDEQGMSQNNYFDFEITGDSPKDAFIQYVVTARIDSSSTLDRDVVKIGLSNQENQKIGFPCYFEHDENPTFLHDEEVILEQYSKIDPAKYVEKVVYRGYIPENTKNFEKQFRARIWIDEYTDFSPIETIKYYCNNEEVNEETYNNCSGTINIEKEQEYLYNDKTFKITFNVYSHVISNPEPGLYTEDFDKLYTWQELKNNGMIGIYEGGAYVEHDEDFDQIDLLNGILVISDECDWIPWDAFNGSNLRGVILPNTITKIGGGAFIDSHIKFINIPDSVTEIYRSAFEKTDIRNLKLSSGIATVPESLCSGCQFLESLVLPDTITEIEDDAFAFCYNLTDVKLSNMLEKIGAFGFHYCKELSEITFPSTLKYIGPVAFSNDFNLTSVTFGDSNGWIASSTANGSNPESIEFTDPASNAYKIYETYKNKYIIKSMNN